MNLTEVIGLQEQDIKTVFNIQELDSQKSLLKLNQKSIEDVSNHAEDRLNQYIKENPDLTWDDLFGKREIIPYREGKKDPYRVIAVLGEYAQLPQEFQYKIAFKLNDLEYTDTTANLNRRRITLSFLEQENKLIPRLLVSNKEVARGRAVENNSKHLLEIIFTLPGQEKERVLQEIVSNAYYAFGFDLGHIPDREIFFRADIARRLKKDAREKRINSDSVFGEILFVLAKSYFYKLDKSYELYGRLNDILWVRQPSLIIAGIEIKNNKEPIVFLDLKRNIITPFSPNGDREDEKRFMLTSGLLSSSYESFIIEEFTGGEAVSTTYLLQKAQDLSIPVWQIDSENWNGISRKLKLDRPLINEIKREIDKGWLIFVPEAEISSNSFSNQIGYISLDPETNSADFRLRTIKGGQGLIAELLYFYKTLPNPVDNLKKILSTDKFPEVVKEIAQEAGKEVPTIAPVMEAIDMYDKLFKRISLFGVIGGLYLGNINTPPYKDIYGDNVEELKKAVFEKIIMDSVKKSLSLTTSFGPQISKAPYGKVVISVVYGLAFEFQGKIIEERIKELLEKSLNEPRAIERLDRLTNAMLGVGLNHRLVELYHKFVIMPSIFGTPGIIY